MYTWSANQDQPSTAAQWLSSEIWTMGFSAEKSSSQDLRQASFGRRPWAKFIGWKRRPRSLGDHIPSYSYQIGIPYIDSGFSYQIQNDSDPSQNRHASSPSVPSRRMRARCCKPWNHVVTALTLRAKASIPGVPGGKNRNQFLGAILYH